MTITDVINLAHKYGTNINDLKHAGRLDIGLSSCIYRSKEGLLINPDVILAFEYNVYTEAISHWQEYLFLKKEKSGYIWVNKGEPLDHRNLDDLTIEYLEKLIKKCKKKLIKKQQQVKLKEIENDFI